MRILLLTFLLAGCASGDWTSYNYGPGDWLDDNTPLDIETMYNYAHFIEPTIEVHYVKSVEAHCGTKWVQGCSYLAANHCDIYVSEVVSPSTLAHEERHCRGWDHYKPQYELFLSMGPEFRAKEIERTNAWFPLDATALIVAMVEDRRTP